jgi:glycosyltransferase involved in cell wall biosynthesis
VRQIVPLVCEAGGRSGAFRTTVLSSPGAEDFWRGAAPSAEVVLSTVYPMRPPQNWRIPRQIGPLRPDLYFYPAHDPPLLSRTPLAFTVHDVTLFRQRPYFETFDRAKLAYLTVITRAALLRARAIFAVSNVTRQQILEVFGDALAPKVHVTPNGMAPLPAEAVEARAAAGPCDRLLYVGSDRPHKNLHRVIRAYGVARARTNDLPRLEIVGGMRSLESLKATVRDAGADGHVVFRGHVPSAELEACYAHAQALIFPSVAEGFGLPILEGMARGVPVLTSNVSGCAEVAGDAALTVDPLEVEQIAAGMLRLVRDASLREDLARRGHARVAEFTWQRTASQTAAVLTACLSA